MKLLHLGSSWPEERPGGVPRYFTELTASLAARGHEVLALAAGRSPPGSAGLTAQSLGLLGTSLPKRWRATRRLSAKALADGYIPCIHYLPHGMALLDALGKRPFVYYFHGPASLEARVEGRSEIFCRTVDAVERAFYRRASVVACLSEAFAQIVIGHYGVDSARVIVIPGGLGEPWFGSVADSQAAREQLGWSASKAHILAVRRLVRRVGIDHLLQALACPERLNSVVLHVVGEGPLRAVLKEKSIALGLKETVCFHGMVPDQLLPSFYAAADFTVIPSLELEGFGMAAIESLALGTPVLATPIGGLPEILRPFDPSCMTRDTSPEALREGIEAMLAFALTPEYRCHCRGYAKHSYYSSGLVVRHEEDIYQHLADLEPIFRKTWF